MNCDEECQDVVERKETIYCVWFCINRELTFFLIFQEIIKQPRILCPIGSASAARPDNWHVPMIKEESVIV